MNKREEIIHIEEVHKVEVKHKVLGALFDFDIYLLFVWYRFLRLLKLELSQFLTNTEKNLAITFNKFYISTCISITRINGENVK